MFNRLIKTSVCNLMASKAILSESEVNRITLEYFTNPSYYGEIGRASPDTENERKKGSEVLQKTHPCAY